MYVGANALVIGDITIVNNSIIGTGTIVAKDIEDNHVAVSVEELKKWK